MSCQNKMRLCGGTFLVLLLESKGQRRNSRMREGRSSDGKSNPEIFSYLVRMVNPDFQMPMGRSFNTFTSDYKLCRSSDNPTACLTDDIIIQKFDNLIKTKYHENLGIFFGYLEKAIALESKGPWLVAALIDLIEADSTIPDDALFYVHPYGHAVKKTDLKNIECICISSFILGVWHYIITQVQDNTVGASTIDVLLEKSVGSRVERKFVSTIGKQTVSEINTSVQPPESELENYHDPSLENTTNNIPFELISSDVAVDLRNIKNGQVYGKGNEVFYLDKKSHDSFHTYKQSPFDTYIKKADEFYSMVKTLLYSEAPRKFRDFYVPNDVNLKAFYPSFEETIKSRPIEVLAVGPYGNIIIRGTGGIGKTMMMRHLFLHFTEQFKEGSVLPILVSLKNFKNQIPNLADFIFKAIHDFDNRLEFVDFESLLKDGKCLLLLDGLDEIPTTARDHFDNLLLDFTKAYQKNHIIISSRPTSSFLQFDQFLVFDIVPFNKKKALELIDKLDFHDSEAKTKFRNDLDNKLFESHKQFASNPLLLTIMLMTYTSYGEIPAKWHIFYAKAYETLARLHDASKGAYVRQLHTGLSPEDFAVYFSEFCARTYKDEILEFDDRIFNDYMEKVISHQRRKIDAMPRDFLLDLTDNLCIMYKEGEKYYFIHRSFQEYFTAVFFSNQMDDQLCRIGDFFEHQRMRMTGDRTFDMLYDMIPSRIDRYIFLPHLKQLWTKCDSSNGYWTFLNEMYPVIYVQEGELGHYTENTPVSYFYNFIVNETLHRHNGELHNLKWPPTINHCEHKEWASIQKEVQYADGKCRYRTEIVEVKQDNNIQGTPKIEGISWKIKICELLNHNHFFSDLILFMENDSFPLKKEYNEMRKYTEHLNKTINEKPSSDDWFDSF